MSPGFSRLSSPFSGLLVSHLQSVQIQFLHIISWVENFVCAHACVFKAQSHQLLFKEDSFWFEPTLNNLFLADLFLLKKTTTLSLTPSLSLCLSLSEYIYAHTRQSQDNSHQLYHITLGHRANFVTSVI